MKTVFFDLENMDNPANGSDISEPEEIQVLFDKLRFGKPFICELESEDGYTLTLGLGSDTGCARYAYADGVEPFWLAIGDGSIKGDHVFYQDGQPITMVDRYCLPYDMVKSVAMYFIETGKQCPDVRWETV